MDKTVSRRTLLKLLALTAGGTLSHSTARALGITAPSSYAGPLRLQGQGAGKRVVILGAGMAGLTAAYELGKLGYACTVLEARDRVGGRAWTVRRGDAETEIGGESQTCAFDDDQLFNAGPDRIPQHHRAVLSYCKELGIPMRAFITLNTAAYHYRENAGAFSGRRTRISEVFANLQGHTSALLVAAIQAGTLDAELPGEDKARMIAFLESHGHLSEELTFDEAEWAGFDPPKGAFLQEGKPLAPLDLSALLQAEYWHGLPIEWELNQQMALLHPVDGMDAIPRALAQQVGDAIEFGAEAREIRRTPQGVRVVVGDRAGNRAGDRAGGQTREVAGDYCVCTIPLPVLANIPNDFPAQAQRAIRDIAYLPGATMGLQFGRRFWEDDDFIYGGGTFTNLSIGQIWYPSLGYHAPKGVLRGVHVFGDDAQAFGNLPLAARVDEATTHGAKIHPPYRDALESAFSVAWHKMAYSLGAWADYSPEARATLYPRLLQFDDRIFLAGDHMSHLSGWMEGAVLSAQHVARTIHERALQGR